MKRNVLKLIVHIIKTTKASSYFVIAIPACSTNIWTTKRSSIVNCYTDTIIIKIRAFCLQNLIQNTTQYLLFVIAAGSTTIQTTKGGTLSFKTPTQNTMQNMISCSKMSPTMQKLSVAMIAGNQGFKLLMLVSNTCQQFVEKISY